MPDNDDDIVDVYRADGPKCPRCWRMHGIPDNHLGMCDRCCDAILEGLSDLVTRGQLTEEEADALREDITIAKGLQVQKYKRT